MERHPLAIRWLIILVLLALLVLSNIVPLQYLFDEGLSAHKTWFPRFYLLTFSFFKGVIPLLVGIWLTLFVWPSVKSKSGFATVLLFLASALLCFIMVDKLRFTAAIALVVVLPFFEIARLLFVLLLPFAFKAGHAVRQGGFVLKYGFLLGYMLACLLIKDGFLPFYKFSMYNKIDERNYVFMLRDSKGALLPLDEYLTIGENGLYGVYKVTHNEDAVNKVAADSISTKVLWQRVLDSKKRSFNGDTVVLIKKVLQLQNGNIIASEHELYKGRID